MIRVAFQGEPGAYGEEAIVHYFGPEASAMAMPTFASVYGSVVDGSADAAVLPLENSVAGTVGDALDTLATGPLEVIGEVLQPIEHRLLVVPGTMLDGVRRVSSHWQALSQCERFLGSRDWQLVPTADTAGAARDLAAERAPDGAAIASERAAALYGLEVAARAIQDDPAQPDPLRGHRSVARCARVRGGRTRRRRLLPGNAADIRDRTSPR